MDYFDVFENNMLRHRAIAAHDQFVAHRNAERERRAIRRARLETAAVVIAFVGTIGAWAWMVWGPR